MKPLFSMREALTNPLLLGNAMPGPSWVAMRTLAIAAFGEPLDAAEREVFTALTKREREPSRRVKRLVIVAGRRSGKSYQAACACIYLACLCDHSENLNYGETGIVLCIAENVEQARVVFNYAKGVAEQSPTISREIKAINRQTIVFRNGIEIQVRASSAQGLRGLTLVGCVCDEAAAWYRNSGPDADREILVSVTPGLLTTKGMLIVISTPRQRRGILWDLHKKNFGPDAPDDVLVAQAPTAQFNLTITQEEIDAAIAENPVENTSEYLAVFRSDLESYLTREILDACIVPGRFMLPFNRNHAGNYHAFVDPSAGKSDEFALAIAHTEKRGEDDDDYIVVLDYLRATRNFESPDELVRELCETIKSYELHEVEGDNYGSAFTQELFNKNGVTYRLSELNKGQIYSQCIPILSSPGRVELLDDKTMADQFVQLERRVGRGTNRDSIDHPPLCHDDRSNAVAGVLRMAADREIGSSSVWLRL
ncbi:MAG TPA: hypothetical protein VIF02_01795 [Methylocella sp.]|jgi:hypothetical protein